MISLFDLLSVRNRELVDLNRTSESKMVDRTFVPVTGEALWKFWRTRVSRQLADVPVILNLASSEYSRVIGKSTLNGKVIRCHFKEKQAGSLRTVGIYAKAA